MHALSEKCATRKVIVLSLEDQRTTFWGKNIFLLFSHKLPNHLMSTVIGMKQINAVTVLQHQYLHRVPCTNMYDTVINLIMNLLNFYRL